MASNANFSSTLTVHETTETTRLPSGNDSVLKLINRFTQPEWILAEIFNLISIFCVTCICLSLAAYGFRTGKWQKENRSSSTQVNAGAVYTAAIAAYLSSLFRLIPDQVAFNLGYGDKSSKPCESAMDASVTGYVLTIVTVYIFLWFRQHSLYQHPAMQSVNNRRVQCFSCITIIVIVVGCVFSGIAFTVPENYTFSNRGCVSRPKKHFYGVASLSWSRNRAAGSGINAVFVLLSSSVSCYYEHCWKNCEDDEKVGRVCWSMRDK